MLSGILKITGFSGKAETDSKGENKTMDESSEPYTNLEPDLSYMYLQDSEYLFSMDDIGCELLQRWKTYVEIANNNDPEGINKTEQETAFEHFSFLFTKSYSGVITYQSTNAVTVSTASTSSATSSRLPVENDMSTVSFQNINDTIGHPTDVIVTVATNVLQFLEIANDPDEPLETILNAKFYPIRLKPGILFNHSSLSGCVDSSDILIDSCMADNDTTEGDDKYRIPSSIPLTEGDREDGVMSSNRRSFVQNYSVLSILCYWQKNLIPLRSRVGRNIFRIYLDIFRCFGDKMDELVKLYNDNFDKEADTAEKIEKNGLLLEIILEDIVFVLHVLNFSMQFLSFSSPSVYDIGKLTSFGVFSSQPWNSSCYSSMGFTSYDDWNNLHREAGVKGVDTYERIVLEPKSRIHMSTDIDPWSSELVQAGADQLLISIVFKLIEVSTLLVELIQQERETFQSLVSSSPPGSNSHMPAAEDSLSFLAPMVNVYVSCLILETDAVFAALCLMTAQPHTSITALWETHCQTILRSFHMPNFTVDLPDVNIIIRDIALHRGLVCLAINDVFSDIHEASTIRTRGVHSSTRYAAPGMSVTVAPIGPAASTVFTPVDAISFQFESMMIDAILLLANFIHCQGYRLLSTPSASSYEIYIDSRIGQCVVRDDSLSAAWFDDISIKFSCPAAFIASHPACDLWPWNSSFKGDDSFTGEQHTYGLCHFQSSVTSPSTSDSDIDSSIKSSFFYMKNSPLFKLAANSSCRSYPGWIVQNDTGCTWIIFFSAIFNICFSQTIGDLKAGKGNNVAAVERFHTVFTAVVHSVSSCLSENSKWSCFPVLQVHFLIFLVRCFKQAPLDIMALCHQCNVLDLLLGEHFLRGGVQELSILMSSSEFVATSIKDNVYSVDVRLSNAGNKSVSDTVKNGARLAFAWAFVHDAVMDFVRCIIGAAGNITPAHAEQCQIALPQGSLRKDVLQLIQSLSMRNDMYPSDDMVVQVICLISFVIDGVKLGGEIVEICMRSLICCIELCSRQLEAIGIESFFPNSSHNEEFMNRIEKKRPLLWAGRAVTLRLILRLISMSAKNEWIDLFLESSVRPFQKHSSPSFDETDLYDGRHNRLDSYEEISLQHLQNNAHLLSRPSVTRSPSVNSMSSINTQATNKDTHNNNDQSAIPHHRGFVQQIAILLLDSKCREVAVYVLIKSLVTCAIDVSNGMLLDASLQDVAAAKSPLSFKSSPSSSGDKRKPEGAHVRNKFSVRLLACDAIQSLLHFVGFSSKQPSFCDSLVTARMILKSLTSILRSTRHVAIRICLQELFRKSDSIAHILDVLRSSTKPPSAVSSQQSQTPTRLKSFKATLVNNVQKQHIVRQGIALLTAIMSGNTNCKSEFRYVLTSQLTDKSVGGSSSGLISSTIPSSSGKLSRYHNFKLMLVQTESKPSLETFVVLLEMLLDGPCCDSRKFMIDSKGDPAGLHFGLFANNEDRPRICNHCIIPCIVNIIPHCTIPMQICIINTLHNLITGKAAIVNLATFTQTPPLLLDLIMDLFPYIPDEVQVCAVNVMQSLGKYNISVAQLKHMFRLMQSKGDYRPAYTWRLLQALQGMVSDEDGPRHSFVFDGMNSGLKLPPILKWPSTRAFSFSIWFRISQREDVYDYASGQISLHASPTNSQEKFEYRPYILCMRNDNGAGAGFEIFLKHSTTHPGKFKIVLQTVLENGELSTFSPDYKKLPVTSGEWHFLAVSINCVTAGFRTKSELCVMLDGVYLKTPFTFPFGASTSTANSVITHPLIGECNPAYREGVNTTMRGQMGAIYFFVDSLSEGQLRSVRELGPDYLYCFQPFSALFRNSMMSKKQTVDPILSILDGSLTAVVALAYNPAVWSGDYFLDNTPEKNNVKWKSWGATVVEETSSVAIGTPVQAPVAGKMHARRFLGTHHSSTQNVRMALDSLGGLKAILPLFAQFDQPRLMTMESDENLSSNPEIRVDYSIDTNLCVCVLELLGTLLEKSVENKRLLQQLGGFSMVGYFLERVSPLHMTLDALKMIFRLYDRASWYVDAQNSVVDHILCNFKLWLFTPYTVQKHLMEWLLKFALNNPHRLREFVGIQRLFDDLHLLYCYEKPVTHVRTSSVDSTISEVSDCSDAATSPSASTNENDLHSSLRGSIYLADRWINSTTGEMSGERLVGAELQQIRSKLFQIILAIMTIDGSTPYPEDLEAMVGYAMFSTSVNAKIEVLRFLLHLLSSPMQTNVPAVVLLGLACSQGINPILQLHSHVNTQVRMYSLLIFCKVMHVASYLNTLPSIPQGSKYFKFFEAETPEASSTPPASSRLNKAKSPTPADDTQRDSESGVESSGHSHAISRSEHDLQNVHLDAMYHSSASGHVNTHAEREDVNKLHKLLESNCFDALGLSPSKLVGIIMVIQQKLVEHMDMGAGRALHEEESEYLKLLNNVQCKIIVSALQLALMGAPCDHLSVDVDKIFISIAQMQHYTNDEKSKKSSTASGFMQHKFQSILEPIDFSAPSERSSSFCSSVHSSPPPSMQHKSFSYEETQEALSSPVANNYFPKSRSLSESTICVPMIFPSLILFLKHDAVPVSLRLSVMVNLKTSILPSLINCDKILRIPAWQDYLFQLIAAERTQLQKLSVLVPADLKLVDKSNGVIDTCIRLISDIQMMAVRIGRPVGLAPLTNPEDPPAADLSIMNVLKGISNGDRHLGVAVLRETMSCLRVYGESGMLDAQQTGLELLHHTLKALHQESDMAHNKSKNDEVVERVFVLNVWLIASIILEFVTVPHPSKSLSDHSYPSPMTVGGVASAEEDQAVRDRGREGGEEVVSSPGSTEASPGSLEVCSVEAKAPVTDALQTRGHTHAVSTHSEESDEDWRLLDIDQPYVACDDATWKLIDSLLNLLGPLDEASRNWLSMEDRPTPQMGLFSSAKAYSQVDEGVKQIVPNFQSSSRASTTLNRLGKKEAGRTSTIKKRASIKPLNQAAGGVFWIIVRVLCSVFSNSGLAGNDVDAKAISNNSLQAYAQLKIMTSSLANKEVNFFDFESINVVARLTEVLMVTKLNSSNEWVRSALDMVMDLSTLQRDSIVSLIIAVQEQRAGKSSSSSPVNKLSFPVISAFNRFTNVGDNERETSTYRPSKLTQQPSALHTQSAVELKLVILERCVKDPTGCSVASITMDALRSILQLPAEVDLTWKLWMLAMKSVAEEARSMEEKALSEKLTEIGLHKHSQEVRVQLIGQRNEEAKIAKRCARKCDAIKNNILSLQNNRFLHVIKTFDMHNKRNYSKWNRIVAELANERGPWGSGAEDQFDVFWVLDVMESDHRTRCKLLRNSIGTKHALASQIQRGTGNQLKDDKLAAAMTPEVETVAFGSASAAGLWKDLVKYQKKDEGTAMMDAEEDLENVEVGLGTPAPGHTDVVASPTGAVREVEEKVLISANVQMITYSTNSACEGTKGVLAITKSRILFTRDKDVKDINFNNKTGNPEFQWACTSFSNTSWPLHEIKNIYQRFYQLRLVAMEFFFTTRTSLFVNFMDLSIARQFFYFIHQKLKPPNMGPYVGRKPLSVIQRSVVPGSSRSITQAWVNREISNFDYLMHLNTIAGRSFNDLAQYPVFPWVIADYTSRKLDLKDPRTYRNLRFPMGAQVKSQRENFEEKYRDLEANYDQALEMARQGMVDVEQLPPFHYGSHYSCMGFVLWYLIRLEPFSSLHVWLQDGKFDKPDRLFDSIEDAWVGCTTNQADVKELIPEFFFLPDFLDNTNTFDLGTKQSGCKVDAVRLPPWARNSHEFVRINSEALESDYVSRHLHHWIDLIFGYKQRPPHMGGNQESVDACNIFFHLTYSGAVDLEQLKANDRHLYNQTVRQIDNFGQTPTQLFLRRHPERLPLEKVDIIWPIASTVWGADTIQKDNPLPEKPCDVICFREYPVSAYPIIYIAEMRISEKLITLDTSRLIGFHTWQVRQPDVVPPYLLKIDQQALRSSQGIGSGLSISSLIPGSYNGANNRERRVGVPFAAQVRLATSCTALVPVTRTLADGSEETITNKQNFEEEEAVRTKRRMRSSSSSKLKSSSSGVHASQGSDSTSTSSGRSRSSQQLSEPPVTPPRGLPSASSMKNIVTPAIALNAPTSPQNNRSRHRANSTNSSTGSSTADVATLGKVSSSAQAHAVARVRRVEDYISCQLFSLLADYKLLFSCGHWDHSLKVTFADSGKLIQSVRHHRDVVTCLAMASDFGQHWLVTGSRDCTVMVWEVFPDRDQPVSAQPLHVLYGHDDVVTTVSVNAEYDVVLSGSEDGTVIVHNLRDGTYVRSIIVGSVASASTSLASSSHSSSGAANTPKKKGSGSADAAVNVGSHRSTRRRIHWIGISKGPNIIIYSNDGQVLFSYSLNGKLISVREAGERLFAFCLSEDGKVLLTGGDRCLIVFRWTRTLDLAKDGPRSDMAAVIDGVNAEESIVRFGSPIRSICLSSQERHLFVGLESGDMRVLAQDSDYLRRRLHYKLMEIGILPQSE